MKKVVLVFIFSFFVGMVTGAYIYITVFHPNFILKIKDSSVGDRENVLTDPISSSIGDDDGLTIVGDSYGVCLKTNDCQSYLISGNGRFIYFDGNQKRSGYIGDELKQSLTKSMVASAPDLSVGTAVSDWSCDTVSNQIEFRYEIRFNNKTYIIDTCRQSEFDTQSDLALRLNSLWSILPVLE